MLMHASNLAQKPRQQNGSSEVLYYVQKFLIKPKRPWSYLACHYDTFEVESQQFFGVSSHEDVVKLVQLLQNFGQNGNCKNQDYVLSSSFWLKVNLLPGLRFPVKMLMLTCTGNFFAIFYTYIDITCLKFLFKKSYKNKLQIEARFE